MKEAAGCGLKKNDLFELKIEDIGNEGEGIGRYQGFAFFVKDAIAGDVICARVLKLKKSYGFAKVEKILTPSKDRVTPRCLVARQCGGCQLQHISYEKQLEYKQNKVRACLERIGGVENPLLRPILGMEEPFYYRNKALFPVGVDKEGHPVIGFYAGRTHSIVDTRHCCIQAKVNEDLIAAVREYLEECKVSIYEEEKHRGLVRHILTRVGFATGEIMVCLVINGESLPPKAERLKEKLLEAVERYNGKCGGGKREREKREGREGGEEEKGEGEKRGEKGQLAYRLASICFNVNCEKTNVVLGGRVIPFYGNTYIADCIGKVKFLISPLSFYQVNPRQTLKLYQQVLAYAGLMGKEIVWDLFCGIGTISLFLAENARQVYGVEIVPDAIEDARKNAVLNGIGNAEFFVGAAEEVLPQQYEKSGGTMRADVVVVDPPRKGCEISLLETIVAMGPERVVYVSCDPATLARDVRYLAGEGYAYVEGRAFDQFGMSGHVECVVLMSRVEE